MEEKTNLEKLKEGIYSEKFEKEVLEILKFAVSHARVNVYEWRNFIDYDILPLVKLYIENTQEAISKDIDYLGDSEVCNCKEVFKELIKAKSK